MHHYQARVTYGYILVDSLYNVIRAFSDIFILWGTWRVLIRYKYLRSNLEETGIFQNTTVVAGLLWFLALYHLCLLFALCFAWLSFSDLNVINTIAKGASSFEIAFTAVQFTSTILTVLWAGRIANGPRENNPYKMVRSHTLDVYI
jgi:hypothetical protein